MLRIAIIPAYEPPSSFYEYARSLTQAVDRLIVVDDGSGSDYAPIFSKISTLPNATVISYDENRGKGYALKTAFTYCGSHFDPDDILVTADCDGQHTISDVLAVCKAAASHPDACILGSRDFSQPNVPPRSRAGNTQMLRLLRLLYGIDISDRQTGLRAFTVKTAQAFRKVSGDRFEYETGTLIYAKRNHIPVREYLLKNECLIVYPDIQYTDGYDKPSEIYDGFLYLGDLYFKKTGKRISFVPLLIDDENRRIIEGTPVRVTNFRAEGVKAAEYLKRAINKEDRKYDHNIVYSVAADQQPVCKP